MNGGHGHVVPRQDGAKARCGGPAICHECALEFARLHYRKGDTSLPAPEQVVQGITPLEKARRALARELMEWRDAGAPSSAVVNAILALVIVAQDEPR
jgi:hypothetical protein